MKPLLDIDERQIKTGIVFEALCCSRYKVKVNAAVVSVVSKYKLRLGDSVTVVKINNKWQIIDAKTKTTKNITVRV